MPLFHVIASLSMQASLMQLSVCSVPLTLDLVAVSTQLLIFLPVSGKLLDDGFSGKFLLPEILFANRTSHLTANILLCNDLESHIVSGTLTSHLSYAGVLNYFLSVCNYHFV